MRLLSFIALFFLALTVADTANAQRNSDFRDSVDFLMDDGEMTPDEMEQEAIGVYNRCVGHLMRNRYYDCECISGAFLQMREELGPYVEQFKLLEDVYTQIPECVNAEQIAGSSYKSCSESVNIYRALQPEEENEEYCSCVGKETAAAFARNPGLRKNSLINTHSEAKLRCTQKHPIER